MLVDKNGMGIPPADMREKMENMQNLMAEIQAILVTRKADINDMMSCGVNLILQAYRHIPFENEQAFIQGVSQFIAQGFGHATAQKAEERKIAATTGAPSVNSLIIGANKPH